MKLEAFYGCGLFGLRPFWYPIVNRCQCYTKKCKSFKSVILPLSDLKNTECVSLIDQLSNKTSVFLFAWLLANTAAKITRPARNCLNVAILPPQQEVRRVIKSTWHAEL